MKSDLREGEYLCALSFVKRRFSRYFKNIPQGWEVPHTTPSTDYLAAAHWLEKIILKAGADTENSLNIQSALMKFHESVQNIFDSENHNINHSGRYGEYQSTIEIRCVADALEQSKLSHRWKWVSLDGGVFFENNLKNKRLYPERLASKSREVLATLRKVADMSEPSPFSAILRMDGDNLTNAMSNPNNNRDEITQKLGGFNQEVPRIVRENSGFLVYSGGDDVLALFPIEDTLQAAAQLRNYYLKFMPHDEGKPMTISAAIVYAHTKMALTSALQESHHLLDDVAKAGTGRDAIAASVWKPAGETLQWVQKWNEALDGDEVVVSQLAEEFKNNQSQDSQFSSKFFYKIHERFDLLNPKQSPTGEVIAVFGQGEDYALQLMTMEYLNSWGRKQKPEGQTQEAIC